MRRDVLIKPYKKNYLIMASDNSAGIGKRKLDVVQADPKLVGRLTARVALAEAMSLGGKPLAVSCTLSFPMTDPDAQEIITGILQIMRECGLSPHDLTGSCETNFPQPMTTVSIHVVASVEEEKLLLKRVIPGDSVFVLGKPLVGVEVLENLDIMVSLNTINKLQTLPQVHEIIPVGSKGIIHELNQLLAEQNWGIACAEKQKINMEHSAGPASCLLVIGQLEAELLQTIDQQYPITYLGKIKEA